MVRRHIRWILFGSLIVLIAGAGALYAQGGPGGRGGRGFGGPGGPGGAGLPLRELNLTDAQSEQVRQITQQHRQQMQTLVERHRTVQNALWQAVETVPVDEARIRTASQDVAEVETDLAIARARIHSEVYALLTPEQQQTAQKLRADREARMKERAGRLQQRLQNRQNAQPRPQA